MKMDRDLLFTLLEKKEGCPGSLPLILSNGIAYGGKYIPLESTPETFPALYEHIMMLGDLNLAEVRKIGQTQAGPGAASVDRITAEGYSFLSEYRHQKELEAKKTSSLDFDHMKTKKIFIGHGHSMVWKDLRDFIKERLKLTPNEFNSVPTAGKSTKERLSDMLDESVFAFIVMTAEDEDSEGNYHARANVIHEAGLFQGRLGFERAIILLEDECKDFSNIDGLTQIRFPKNNIKSIFEEIRRVLEREGIIL